MGTAWKIWRGLFTLTSALLLAGACRSCPGGTGLAVQGETPYVRCLAGQAPEARTLAAGRARFALRDRRLVVSGLGPVTRIAAFSGAGFESIEQARGALLAAKPDLAFMLGGLGDTEALARASAKTLNELPLVTVFVAGGRDSRERVGAALGAAPKRVLDATALRSIQLGGDTWLPIAGTLDGREGLAPDSCGYGADDLDAIAAELAKEPGRRWLLAADAPGGGGPFAVARTERGIDAGSPSLASFGTAVGARGGLFGGPHVQVLRPATGEGATRVPIGVEAAFAPDLRLVVPRVAGAAMERSDGSRVAPALALLELGPAGLRVLEVRPTWARKDL